MLSPWRSRAATVAAATAAIVHQPRRPHAQASGHRGRLGSAVERPIGAAPPCKRSPGGPPRSGSRQAQARRIWTPTFHPAERLFMAASQRAPQSTVQAAQLLLARLKALAEPSVEGRDVRSTLLAVPEDKRDHVLAVLGELVGRTSDKGFDDLSQGARLVLNAARELWRDEGKAAETAPGEAESSASGQSAD